MQMLLIRRVLKIFQDGFFLTTLCIELPEGRLEEKYTQFLLHILDLSKRFEEK